MYQRVTHPFAALSIFHLPERISNTNTARLACVRRTASVHPELGSNSFKLKMPNKLGLLIILVFLAKIV